MISLQVLLKGRLGLGIRGAFPGLKFSLQKVTDGDGDLESELSKLGFSVKHIKLSGPDFNAIQFLTNTRYEQEKKQEIRSLLIDAFIKKNPDAKVVIFPSVISRNAKAKARQGRWDGVKHSLPIEGKGHRHTWSGDLYALSLKLDVYSIDSKWQFTSYGGIAIHYKLNTKTGEFVLKDDIFGEEKDREYLTKGVKVAINPFKKKYMYK